MQRHLNSERKVLKMEEVFEEITRRVTVTARSRFYASLRLKRHNTFSLWTVIVSSLAIIFASLVPTSNMAIRVNQDLLNLSTVFSSITILAVSTALTMSNFASRADRFSMCGKELNELLLKLFAIKRSEPLTMELYEQINSQYAMILSKYENHGNVDFLFTQAVLSKYYTPKWHRWPGAYLRYFAEFAFYLVWLTGLIAWFAFALSTP